MLHLNPSPLPAHVPGPVPKPTNHSCSCVCMDTQPGQLRFKLEVSSHPTNCNYKYEKRWIAPGLKAKSVIMKEKHSTVCCTVVKWFSFVYITLQFNWVIPFHALRVSDSLTEVATEHLLWELHVPPGFCVFWKKREESAVEKTFVWDCAITQTFNQASQLLSPWPPTENRDSSCLRTTSVKLIQNI